MREGQKQEATAVAVASRKNPQLRLDKGHVLEYVGGEQPYVWIGSPDGTYFDSVSLRDLRKFLEGRRS